jgi:HEPN domain-containing protein
VFFAQQSAEKALKSLCLVRLKEIPKGHSIIYLAQKLKVPIGMLSGIRDLNPEYLVTRYPDMAAGIPAELYDEPISKRHMNVAKEVFAWVKKQIQK